MASITCHRSDSSLVITPEECHGQSAHSLSSRRRGRSPGRRPLVVRCHCRFLTRRHHFEEPGRGDLNLEFGRRATVWIFGEGGGWATDYDHHPPRAARGRARHPEAVASW